jgi:hypothetical protein
MLNSRQVDQATDGPREGIVPPVHVQTAHSTPPPHPKRISYCLARMLDFENPAGVDLYLDHGADPNFRVPWLRNRTHLHRAVATATTRPSPRC